MLIISLSSFLTARLMVSKPILTVILHEVALSIYRWYYGKIKRVDAEKRLLCPDNEHGSYLIRDSESRRNDFSLSGKSASSANELCQD